MSGLNNNEFRLHQFSVEVCDIIRQIPAGKVLTYGQIARLAGFSNYSRWVGKVLSHHPGTAALPCHRVVNSQGRTAPHWPGPKKLTCRRRNHFSTEWSCRSETASLVVYSFLAFFPDRNIRCSNINTVMTPMTNPFPTIGRIRAGILFNASSGAKDNNKATINENPTTSPPSKPSTAFSRIIICIPADNCEAIR